MTGDAVRQASLIRGINVGKAKRVSSQDLKRIYEGIGGEDVQTLLQSGNVVLRHAGSPADVSSAAEGALKRELGLGARVVGRSHAELVKIAADRTFDGTDGNRRFVTFFEGLPKRAGLQQLEALAADGERLHLSGHELHMALAAGIGTSRLQLTVIEKALGTAGTTRNWNTLLKLVELTGR